MGASAFDTAAWRRDARYRIVSAGHKFLQQVLPLRRPHSDIALDNFLEVLHTSHLSTYDIENVIIQCLNMLDRRARLPGLVARYMSSADVCSNSTAAINRFAACVKELLRHHGVADPGVQAAISVIEEHFQESDLSTGTVALKVNRRPSQLSAAFKRETGLTLSAYLQHYRLGEAARLLVTTDKIIKEVWTAVGYNHASNFDHDFKRRFGLTPKEYRSHSIRTWAFESYGQDNDPGLGVRHITRRDPIRVLVIDDDQGSRETIGRYLELESFTVGLANDGAQGLTQADLLDPQATLIDYRLPDMDGIECLRQLRERPQKGNRRSGVALFTADLDVYDREDDVRALVSRIRDSLTKSGDLGEDFVSGFGPDEWFRRPVANGQILANGGFERPRAAMRAALDLLLRQGGKPALDQVQPRGARRGEVHMKPRMASKPSAHPRRLVRPVVVENQMNVEVRRRVRVDRVQKLQELLTAMPPVQFANHPAGGHIERGEQRGRPVTHVIMRAPFRLARAQRQNRRGAVERLNLAFFIDRQEQGAIRRAEVQPDDVAHLVDEQRILRQLKRVDAVRLQGKRLPDPRDRRLTHVAVLGQAARRPVRRIVRHRFQRRRQDALHIGIGDRARHARTRLVEQPIQTAHQKATAPFADRLLRDVDVPRNRGRGFTRGAAQHQTRAQGQGLRRGRAARPPFERFAFLGRQHHRSHGSAQSHRRVLLVAEYDGRPKYVSRISNSPH
jgi:AraC-like DNA-binding protein/CheY-like chemotaxis protein